MMTTIEASIGGGDAADVAALDDGALLLPLLGDDVGGGGSLTLRGDSFLHYPSFQRLRSLLPRLAATFRSSPFSIDSYSFSLVGIYNRDVPSYEPLSVSWPHLYRVASPPR